MSFTIYKTDPWLYYRIDDATFRWLDGAYISPGLIKHKEYDMAVIGSSYFQDFRMQWFRDKLNVEPVNLTAPGLDTLETARLVNSLGETGKAEKALVCLTLSAYEQYYDKNRLPYYLYDLEYLNDFKYWFSYEAWIKFMPLDIATIAIDKVNPRILARYESLRDIDSLGNELNRFTYSDEIVWKNFYNGISSMFPLPEQQKQILLEKMKGNFRSFLSDSKLASYGNIEFTFVLPPHSVLFWKNTQLNGRYDVYMDFEKYVISELSKFDNVRVTDCFTMDEVTNLNCYRDNTHYNLEVQEKIVDVIANGENYLTPENIDRHQQKLSGIIESYSQENAERFRALGLF